MIIVYYTRNPSPIIGAPTVTPKLLSPGVGYSVNPSTALRAWLAGALSGVLSKLEQAERRELIWTLRQGREVECGAVYQNACYGTALSLHIVHRNHQTRLSSGFLDRQSRVSRQGLFARRVPGQDADARELFEPELSV